MSNVNVKEFLVPLLPFHNVTVGKKYPVIHRDKDMCLIKDDIGSDANWWISPGEFELVEEVNVPVRTYEMKLEGPVYKAKREMKFSDKPGSAVVTYDTGETFHISRLTSVEVFKNDDDVLIDVTRTYTKDGLLFQQRVGIPVEKFVKLVWNSPGSEEVVAQEVLVTYDKEKGTLVYGMSFYADVIDFT